MAAFQKRGDAWRALVRRRGMKPVTKTFRRKADAQAWARQIEVEFDRGALPDISMSDRVTVGELLDRYAKETEGVKRNAPKERSAIKLLKERLGHHILSRLGVRHVSEFRDERRREGRADSTIRNNINLLSAVLTKARNDWGYHIPENPAQKVSKPEPRNQRSRRVNPEEETRLLDAARKIGHPQTPLLIVVAIETGMRLGELLDLTWGRTDLKSKVAKIPETKNGEYRDVPLSARAVDAIKELPPGTGEERPFNNWKAPDSFNKTWHKVLDHAGSTDLRFHDLRHEAASRLNELGISTRNLAAITGHKSFQMLRRYSHPPAGFLAELVDKLKAQKDKEDKGE